MVRLITIPISHYCEKARWALDRANVPYREERHVQGVHVVVSHRAGGAGTVPVLVTPDGAIGESAEILEWVDARTPAEHRLLGANGGERRDALELCRRLDERLGPSGRRLMYVHMLAQRERVLQFNNQGVPRWEDRLVRWGWPLVTSAIKSRLGIRPGVEGRDEAEVWHELDGVAQRLADGRSFLCSERFGIADLTFAALAAPVVVPPVYGVALPQPELMAPATAALVRRARAHPAGAFAMRMFAEHRRQRVV